MTSGSKTALQRKTAYLAAIAADRTSPDARAAFAQLIRLWHPRFIRFASSRVPDMADDVLQDAVLTMAQNIGRLQSPERFASWAFTIIARRAVDAQRHAVRERNASTDEMEHREIALPTSDTAIDLKEALSRLSITEQRLLLRFHVQGLTLTELAIMLNVPLGTIKSRLHTARQKLRDQLATQETMP